MDMGGAVRNERLGSNFVPQYYTALDILSDMHVRVQIIIIRKLDVDPRGTSYYIVTQGLQQVASLSKFHSLH